MIFTVENVAKSLANYLAPMLPGVTFYEGPNQQGSKTPCLFLQQRYSRIRKRQAGRWFRTVGLDLTCLEDYNLPNLQALYEAAAEKLDQALENLLDILLGFVCGLLPTFLSDMRVNIHGSGDARVPQSLLQGLIVFFAFQGGSSIKMPLWHNKGKSENPCVTTG